MSSDELLAEVRAVVLRELEGLDPSSLVLRIDGGGADRSVFVVAQLGRDDGAVMVARVYEDDLSLDGACLQPVFLSSEDAEVLAEALRPRVRARA
jgi:hypothetical protein